MYRVCIIVPHPMYVYITVNKWVDLISRKKDFRARPPARSHAHLRTSDDNMNIEHIRAYVCIVFVYVYRMQRIRKRERGGLQNWRKILRRRSFQRQIRPPFNLFHHFPIVFNQRVTKLMNIICEEVNWRELIIIIVVSIKWIWCHSECTILYVWKQRTSARNAHNTSHIVADRRMWNVHTYTYTQTFFYLAYQHWTFFHIY